MTAPSTRRACAVSVGETRYARWGGMTDASEHALALAAILEGSGGVRLLSNLVDSEPAAVQVGMPVQVVCGKTWRQE